MGTVPKDPKRCAYCKQEKPRAEFYPHSVAKRGVSAWCKVCTNERSTAAQRTNVSKSRLATKRYQTKKKYGMTLEQYDEMLAAQNGRCAICATDTPGGMGRFPVDHCHHSGRIRGLLCTRCNTGLGLFRDNTDALRKAASYIERGGHGIGR